MRRTFIALWLAATCVAAVTCVRIEWLNAQAGYYLPRSGMERDVKWRQLPRVIAESLWREKHLGRDAQGQPSDRPLTSADQRAFAEYWRPHDARNRLRDVVSNWGLLQYPLLAAALTGTVLLASIGPAPRLRLLIVAVGAAQAVMAGLMIYRGYFTSLGW